MRADRLLSIMLLLQSNGKMTTFKLAELLEVSRRTILRDIDALTTAGVPIYTESGQGGGVYLDEKYQISLTGLNLDEIRSLFISSWPGPLKDIGLEFAAESSYLKLKAALPASHQNEVELIRQSIHIDSYEWWSNSRSIQFLTELLTAVFQGTITNVIYKRADGNIIERVLEPYRLVAKATVWYLIAAHNGQFRTYKVSRFQAVELLGESFERVANFDLRGYMADQIKRYYLEAPHYTCTLEMKTECIEKLHWSFIEELRVVKPANRAGWQIVELKLNSVEAIEMLVVALGQDAFLLEPAYLLDLVLTKTRIITEMYGALNGNTHNFSG